jgi:hypothetical protein
MGVNKKKRMQKKTNMQCELFITLFLSFLFQELEVMKEV